MNELCGTYRPPSLNLTKGNIVNIHLKKTQNSGIYFKQNQIPITNIHDYDKTIKKLWKQSTNLFADKKAVPTYCFELLIIVSSNLFPV